MPEISFVRSDRANQRQLRKFIRPSPAKLSLANFFYQVERRANGANVQSTYSIGVSRKELADFGSGEGDSAMCAENRTFGMLPV